MTYAELWKALVAKKIGGSWSLDIVGWHHHDGATTFTWRLWLCAEGRNIITGSPEELLALYDVAHTVTTPETIGDLAAPETAPELSELPEATW